MAGPSIEDDSDLKGINKIFNGRTMSGRANVSPHRLKGYVVISKASRNFLLTGCKTLTRRIPVLVLVLSIRPQ